jgi:hypothetical protein
MGIENVFISVFILKTGYAMQCKMHLYIYTALQQNQKIHITLCSVKHYAVFFLHSAVF